MYSQTVEHFARMIVYYVQTNESMELSDKSLHDIFHQVRECADIWKKYSDKLRDENHALRWNEAKLYVERHKERLLTLTADEIIKELEWIIKRLDNKESVR
ncbi:hypothetical protein [Alkalihalobacillus sp. BA299]|uniref:hypothetical protein n=1 Tax=Alkalihalobacillus sp. BA299 TaxID=2815938 RepID=UPI001ADA9CD8|nr:hypothetical protein [Alkalihalobacillus sp. BA299]